MLRVLYINTSNVRIHVICLRFVIVVRRLFWQGRANLYSLGFQWVRRVLLGLRGAQLHMALYVTCGMSGALYIVWQGRASYGVVVHVACYGKLYESFARKPRLTVYRALQVGQK